MPALLETTKKALFEPTRFFAGVSPGVGIGGPLLYALIVGYIGVAAAAVYSALSETLLRSMWGDLFGRGPFGDTPFGALPPWLEGGFGLILKLIFAPVALVIMIFVMAAIFHVILTLLGDTTKGFVTTLQVVCYGEATSLFRVVPGCGGLIAPIYFIVLAIIGLSEAHGVSRAKSAVAVLLPIVLGCCCGVLVGAFIAWGAAGYMRR